MFILAVFGLFFVNAVGLIDFSNLSRGDIGINLQVWHSLWSDGLAGPLRQVDCVSYIVVALVLAVVLPMQTPVGASLVTFFAMLPPFYVAWFYPYPPPVVPLEYALVTILVLYSVNVLSSYFIETQQRQKIVSAFGQYVPPVLVDRFSSDPDAFSMEGESRELSVMFCDVRNFTAISERLESRQLAEMMNHYLTAMTDILHRHGATIDKYIGDAIMAFWGAPIAQSDHASRAVQAAIEMQAAMPALAEEFVARGWPALRIGIGLNTGVMNVGNMGSRYRIAYTVLGDAVNVAARLESLTRHYDVDTLVSDATRVAAGGDDFGEIDHVRLKGKGQPIRVYELNAAGGDRNRQEDENAALDAYYRGEWSVARTGFRTLNEAHDRTWYRVMLQRMEADNPPQGFDGIVSYSAAMSYSLTAPVEPDA